MTGTDRPTDRPTQPPSLTPPKTKPTTPPTSGLRRRGGGARQEERGQVRPQARHAADRGQEGKALRPANASFSCFQPHTDPTCRTQAPSFRSSSSVPSIRPHTYIQPPTPQTPPYKNTGALRGHRPRREPHRAGGVAPRALPQAGHPLRHRQGQGPPRRPRPQEERGGAYFWFWGC